MDTSKIILIIIALIVLCYYYMGQTASTMEGEKFVVYGTTWCGYTTKQREYLDKKYGRGSHTFVDCDKENCPGITAFPVTQTPKGAKVKGFNETL